MSVIVQNEKMIESDQSSDDPIILLVPQGVKPPAGLKVTIVPWELRNTVRHLLDATGVSVVETDPNAVATVVKLAQDLDLEVKVLRGFEGEYPSFWLIQTGSLPVVQAKELIELGQAAEAVGGTGIDPAKAKKAADPVKTASRDHLEKVAEMADTLWESGTDVVDDK